MSSVLVSLHQPQVYSKLIISMTIVVLVTLCLNVSISSIAYLYRLAVSKNNSNTQSKSPVRFNEAACTIVISSSHCNDTENNVKIYSE